MVIRKCKVPGVLGVSKSTFYDWTNEKSPRFKSDFPSPIRLGKNSIAYILEELIQWLNRNKIMVKPQQEPIT